MDVPVSRGAVRYLPIRHRDGALPPNQAYSLLSIAVAKSPDSVFEIGTYWGHTTLLLARNLPDAIIHTIDLPEDFNLESDDGPAKDDMHLIKDRRVGSEYLDLAGSERIVQYFGDTATWDFSPVKGCSFFFIDGAHTYEYTKNDTEKCLDACGGKGTFLWHDCDDKHPGVVRYLEERSRVARVSIIRGTCLAYEDSSV